MIDLFKPKHVSLATHVPYWGFVGNDAVLTTDGQVLFFAEVLPNLVDGRAAHDLDATTQAWQKLLASVIHPHRVFLIYERPAVDLDTDSFQGDELAMLAQRKRRAWVAGRARGMRVYVALAFQPGLHEQVHAGQTRWWLAYLQRWIAERKRQDHLSFYLRHVVQRAVGECRGLVREAEVLVNQVTPLRHLEGDEIGALLHRLVNQGQGEWVSMKQPLRYGLNWRVADETVAFERRHMVVGDRLVGLFSMALPPAHSGANALGELYAMPHEFSVVLEWRGLDKLKALSRIRANQKHYNTQRWSFWAAMSNTEGTSVALDDAPSSAAVKQLHRAAIEVDTVNVPYGELALSVAVSGYDQASVDAVGSLVQRVFTQSDAKAVKERYGQPAVWFGRFPGQRRQPLPRPVMVSSGQAATLAPLFGGARGHDWCSHLDKPCLTEFETRWGTPYGYDVFAGRDVGHTLVLGATGSGKSFLLNFFLLQMLQYEPRVMILDLGGSYRWLTSFLGGNYLSLQTADGEEKQPGLRPFSLPPGEATYQFLATWVRRLLSICHYECSAAEFEDIRSRVIDVYRHPVEERRLRTLVRLMPREMWAPMSRWVLDGAWAPTFDGPPEETFNLKDQLWQVIDLAGAQEHPDWCAAALFYLFERLRLIVEDEAEIGRLKVMVVDEAWRYLADPAVLRVLMEAAKTWRKRNGVLMLATQSVVDLTASPESLALLEMLPTKLFLANPDFPQRAADVLHLAPSEFEAIRGLEAKRELFLHRAGEKVVLRLAVDQETYWLATSSPVEAAVRAEMVDKYGLAAAIARLAAGERPGEATEIGRREVLA